MHPWWAETSQTHHVGGVYKTTRSLLVTIEIKHTLGAVIKTKLKSQRTLVGGCCGVGSGVDVMVMLVASLGDGDGTRLEEMKVMVVSGIYGGDGGRINPVDRSGGMVVMSAGDGG
ncbi:hypothetical protein Tco_1540369 [Tanacetum coccineum]